MATLKTEADFENLIGPMKPHEFEQLKENLKANPDAFPPIFVWGNYKGGNVIIDGHNQYKARVALGLPVKPKKLDFETRDEAMLFAMRCQLGRRNMDTTRLAVAAVKMADRCGLSQGAAAEALGISRRSVSQATEIAHKCATPLKKSVENGEIAISDAAAVANESKAVQEKALKEVKAGRAKTVKAAAKKISGGASFDVKEIESADAPKAKKSGKPSVTRKDRDNAHKCLGGLIRALKAMDLYDEFVKPLSAIAERLKQV